MSLSLFQGFGGQALSAGQLDLLRAVRPMVRQFIRQFAQCNRLITQRDTVAVPATVDLKPEYPARLRAFW